MIKPDLTTLRIFLAVHGLGNISKAAEREHIASSAISKRIHALETEIGTTLFYRHSRGVTATPAGEALARHALVLFDTLNEMASDLSSYATGVSGQVRIHAHTSAIIQYLPKQIAAFGDRFPDVKIVLREETSASVIQSTVDGLTDIGILAGNVAIPDALQAFHYRCDRLVALVPVDHPLARRSEIHFAEISESDHISLATGSSLQILLADAAQSSGFALKTRIEVKTFESAISMVEAGLGIAVIPEAIFVREPQNRTARPVPLADDWANRRHLICVRNGRKLTSAAGLMLEHLQAG